MYLCDCTLTPSDELLNVSLLILTDSIAAFTRNDASTLLKRTVGSTFEATKITTVFVSALGVAAADEAGSLLHLIKKLTFTATPS